MNNYLLPSGFRDLLPPDARLEQRLMTDILETFYRFGYEQVSPPFMEFEETLLAGKGKGYDPYTFRVMDPISHKMMGLRADMTMQITRIAAARLANAPKPLRLSYAGRVLRVLTDGLSTERQLSQAGIELIGSEAPQADAEIIRTLALALKKAGYGALVLDISLGGLLEKMLESEPSFDEDERKYIRELVKQKNADLLPGDSKAVAAIRQLLNISGNVAASLELLKSLSLPEESKKQIANLETVLGLIPQGKDISVSLDPLESHGFDYHDGLCFSLFLADSRIEVGRGGRYTMEDAEGNHVSATGATLYVRALMQAAAVEDSRSRRVYLPYGTAACVHEPLQAEGYITVAGLAQEKDAAAEARRLTCAAWWDGKKIQSSS